MWSINQRTSRNEQTKRVENEPAKKERMNQRNKYWQREIVELLSTAVIRTGKLCERVLFRDGGGGDGGGATTVKAAAKGLGLARVRAAAAVLREQSRTNTCCSKLPHRKYELMCF